MIVDIKPPIKPSHVFLGDKAIKGVLPKSLPKIYANVSLIVTKLIYNKNQIIPWKGIILADPITNIIKRTQCVQKNIQICILRDPLFNDHTKSIKPAIYNEKNKILLYLLNGNKCSCMKTHNSSRHNVWDNTSSNMKKYQQIFFDSLTSNDNY